MIFHEMLRKITSSPYHNSMRRYTGALNDHFGINHFWYYRISPKGHYCYLGSHAAWSEFCFDNAMLSFFPCLRHPKTLKSGISLMKASDDIHFQAVIKSAWEKFNINFNINLQEKMPDGGIEAFGFGSRFNDNKSDERLLNELGSLITFTKLFRNKHKKLFEILNDSQIDLATQFGTVFYEQPKNLILPIERELLWKKLGFDSDSKLTPRETDLLKFLAYGYPASFIATELRLSQRTIENYIATIKSKLSCKSKAELIQKARYKLGLH